MRKFISFAVLLFCSPLWATWTATQHKCTGTASTDGCASSPCTLSGLSAVGAGHSLIAIMLDDTNNRTISSINGETWSTCTSCRINGSPSQSLDANFVASATGGETSFTMTLSSTGAFNFCIYEAASSNGSVAKDTGGSSGNCTNTITSAAPVSCNLTVSGSNLWIASGLIWGGSVTGSSNYTEMVGPNGNGAAEHVSTTSGTGATWTPTTANSGIAFSLALKEAAGGATVKCTISLMGAGPC